MSLQLHWTLMRETMEHEHIGNRRHVSHTQKNYPTN